jgi:hypothetical protein
VRFLLLKVVGDLGLFMLFLTRITSQSYALIAKE